MLLNILVGGTFRSKNKDGVKELIKKICEMSITQVIKQ